MDIDERLNLMDDDRIEDDDEACPNCGHSPTRRCPCGAIGCDEGFVDMHEYDDPLLFDEGEEEPCRECRGEGYHHWCSNCGWDFVFKRFINGRDESERVKKDEVIQ